MIWIISLLSILHCSDQANGLGWQQSSHGYIPSKSIAFRANTRNKLYFCRTLDEKLGKNYIGTIQEGERVCNYLHKKEPRKSALYQILSLHKPGETYSWDYKDRWAAPPGAVSCGHDCFLGQSFYSDGLCHEFIGTISMKEQLIEAVQNNQVDQCPFFTFLTSNEKEIFNLDPIKQPQKIVRKRWQNKRFNPSWWAKYS